MKVKDEKNSFNNIFTTINNNKDDNNNNECDLKKAK